MQPSGVSENTSRRYTAFHQTHGYFWGKCFKFIQKFLLCLCLSSVFIYFWFKKCFSYICRSCNCHEFPKHTREVTNGFLSRHAKDKLGFRIN